MRDIDKIVQDLDFCIKNNIYKQFETDKIELKDLSTKSDWTELYKSICAFLNTNGGIVIVGVNENTEKKQYKITGFNPNNEENLKQIANQFEDEKGNKINLDEYINSSHFEILDFQEKRIVLLFIEKLPEDIKFVFYKGVAYERKLTGDHTVSIDKINRHKEYKEEIKKATELSEIDNASIEDISLDKINLYIDKLNRDVKVESLKSDITQSLSFLKRKSFININNKPTILGLLITGDEKKLYDIIGGRCQIDCYNDTGIDIANSKKVLKNTVFDILEDAYRFIISNINVGISTDKSGSPIFEYPERLIRECLNNAITHRDYKSDAFNIVTIKQKEYIEIKNPGKFRLNNIINTNVKNKSIRIIIPNANPQNPKLADCLKSFDRWEGKGWGMSKLTTFALENKIDVPYFSLSSNNTISLIIKKGSVLDAEMESWLNLFSKYILTKTNGFELTFEQRTILAFLFKSERLNRNEKFTILLNKDNNHFNVIKDLEEFGLIYQLFKNDNEEVVYLVDETLKKTDNYTQLREIFGGVFDVQSNEVKNILNLIYQFNHYSLQDVTANIVGNYIYLNEKKTISDIKDFENYKRKIRSIFNKLEKELLIVNANKNTKKPKYILNNNFNRQPSIFD